MLNRISNKNRKKINLLPFSLSGNASFNDAVNYVI